MLPARTNRTAITWSLVLAAAVTLSAVGCQGAGTPAIPFADDDAPPATGLLIWQNVADPSQPADGALYWTMNGTTDEGPNGALDPTPESDWRLVGAMPSPAGGTHYFLLWQNKSTGMPWYWTMNGNSHTGPDGEIGTQNPGTDWRLVGSMLIPGGNGNSYLLWQETAGANPGLPWYWQLNGVTPVANAAGQIGTANPGPDWRLVGAMPIPNGNGNSYLLWQEVTGANPGLPWYWTLNGVNHPGPDGALGPAVPAYNFVGSMPNTDGSGNSDLIFQIKSRKSAPMSWVMNNVTKVSQGPLGTAEPSWSLVGSIPFNTCGQPEVGATVLATDCPVVSLFASREGFGAAATGGLGGTYAVVQSNLDDGGATTLRTIIENAKGPLWITFSGDMTINLGQTASQIAVKSNITIDGRGHTITILGQGFKMSDGVSNVILTHLSLNGESCTSTGVCVTNVQDLSKSENSGVRIAGHSVVSVDPNTGLRTWSTAVSKDFWLDHLDITDFPDKLIAISDGVQNITVSYSRLFASKYGILLADDAQAAVSDVPPANDQQDYAYCTQADFQAMENLEGDDTLTVHHTIFASVTQRNPRLTSDAKAHLYNNVFFDWDLYGMSVDSSGQILAQGNLFFSNKNRPCDNIPYPELHAMMGPTNFCSGVPYSDGLSLVNAESMGFYPTNEWAQYCPTPPDTLGGYMELEDNVFAYDGDTPVEANGYPSAAAPVYPSSDFLDFVTDLKFVNYTPSSYQTGAAFLAQAQTGLSEVKSQGVYNVLPPSTPSVVSFPKAVSDLLPAAGNL